MTAVTVLGTGIMGAGMAANLAKAGLDTTVWNRTLAKARPLADLGVRVAEDPSDADAIGSRTVWVGERPGDGHRLKLVANSWVLSIVSATAQAVALAQALGLEAQQWLDTIAGGPLDCKFAQLKETAMIADEYPPAFGLDGAVKDSGLIANALGSAGASDKLMAAMHDHFAEAAARGHSEEDMATVIHAFRST
jgi:3-hydroxyisobutyrate dehydrogenase